jgi:hypothetical protein
MVDHLYRISLRFPVSEGSVRRSDFGMAGILFSHDEAIMTRTMIAVIAEWNLSFDDRSFICYG